MSFSQNLIGVSVASCPVSVK